MTAEFVIALPAVIGVAIAAIGALATQACSIRLASEAFALAQAAQAGQSHSAAQSWLESLEPGARVEFHSSQGILCASVTARPWEGVSLPGFAIHQRSCVWVGEEIPLD